MDEAQRLLVEPRTLAQRESAEGTISRCQQTGCPKLQTVSRNVTEAGSACNAKECDGQNSTMGRARVNRQSNPARVNSPWVGNLSSLRGFQRGLAEDFDD